MRSVPFKLLITAFSLVCMAVGLPLAKAATTARRGRPSLWPLASVYIAEALIYGVLLFRNPVRGATEPGMR